MPNLSSLLERSAAANQVANLLVSRGIQPGDKVALTCPNLPYFTIVYYGILKAGATVVPLNVLLKGREVAYHLDDSDAKAYFCFQGTPELPMAQDGYAGFEHLDHCVDAVGEQCSKPQCCTYSGDEFADRFVTD